MKSIGLLSDTHNHLDPKILNFFKDCDEIWHAGDIGNMEIVSVLSAHKTFRAVFGNIDNSIIRKMFSEVLSFKCEETNVLMKHIGGYPKHYEKTVHKIIASHPPDLFISGHSHILKVIYDKKFNLLHINPGAAGNTGMHKLKTAIRFLIDGKNISNLEIIELKRG